MTNEELILKRLDAIEAKIDPMIQGHQKWDELKEDLIPLQHQAFQLVIEHLRKLSRVSNWKIFCCSSNSPCAIPRTFSSP